MEPISFWEGSLRKGSLQPRPDTVARESLARRPCVPASHHHFTPRNQPREWLTTNRVAMLFWNSLLIVVSQHPKFTTRRNNYISSGTPSLINCCFSGPKRRSDDFCGLQPPCLLMGSQEFTASPQWGWGLGGFWGCFHWAFSMACG